MKGLNTYIAESVINTNTDYDAILAKFDNGVIDQDGAFEVWGADVEDLVIPEGVVEVGYRAFFECKNLRRVTFPSTLVKIGEQAFDGCKNLEEYIFAKGTNNLRRLDYDALGGGKVRKLDLPDCIESVGGAFLPAGVEDLHIPANLKDMDYGAFGGIDIPVLDFSHTRIDRTAENMFYHSGVREVILPETCTRISAGTFDRCYDLETVTAPGVVRVDDNAFHECAKLTKVELAPGAIIGTNAFLDCKSLTELVNPIGGALNKSFRLSGVETLYWDGSGTISIPAIKSCDVTQIVLTTPKNKLKPRVKKNLEEIEVLLDMTIKYSAGK